MAKSKPIDAEWADDVPVSAPQYPPQMTDEEITLNSIKLQCRVKARLEAIDKMAPEERYDAVTSLTQEIALRLADRVLEREVWLSNADPAVREEATNFIISAMDKLNDIKKVEIALYNALGIGEKKGALPGGQEVPRIMIPARTAEAFESEFGEPLGNA